MTRPRVHVLSAVAGGAVLLWLLILIVAPFACGGAANHIDVAAAREGTSAAHLLGTDDLGRDILARTLVAARLSITLALLAVLVAVTAGTVLGALAALAGPRIGLPLAWLIDLMVSFPGLLVALFLAVIFGAGVRGATLALGLAMAPSFARLTYTTSSAIVGSDYFSAARLLGVGWLRLLRRHILPNVAEPMLLTTTVALNGALLAFAGLSFLGLGVQPPAYDWGRLLNEGLDRIYEQPAAALGPAVALVLAGATAALVGEALARRASHRVIAIRVGRGDARDAITSPSRGSGTVSVRNLWVRFPDGSHRRAAVAGATLEVAPGEVVGIVGESGSGKTQLALALGKLNPASASVDADTMTVAGVQVVGASEGDLRRTLAGRLAYVFQDPATTLNPVLSVGYQLAEVARLHGGASRSEAWRQTVDMLGAVGLSAPELRARQRPHELSGGMRQRASIGMALSGGAQVIVADEPTSALDVTVQRRILDLLHDIRRNRGTSILLISHDIGMVSSVCDRIAIMYAGRIVEVLRASALGEAAHPYTRALLASAPRLDADRSRPLPVISGRIPTLAEEVPGCPFAPRCGASSEVCAAPPELSALATAHEVACWHPRSVSMVKR